VTGVQTCALPIFPPSLPPSLQICNSKDVIFNQQEGDWLQRRGRKGGRKGGREEDENGREEEEDEEEEEEGSRLMELKWWRVVVDEGQRATGGGGREGGREGGRGAAMRKLKAEHRWLLVDGEAAMTKGRRKGGKKGGREGAGEEWGRREEGMVREWMEGLFGEGGREGGRKGGRGRVDWDRAMGVFRLEKE